MKSSVTASCVAVFAVLILTGVPASAADEPAVAKALASKGAKLTDTNGTITGIDVPDLSALSDDNFRQISQLTHLQKLSFGKGLSDRQLSILTQLPDVSSFTTNGSELDDQGVAQFSRFKKLQVLTFFHPGKNFKGTGLAELAELADLQSLTVAGSAAFGNDGLAAIARLPHLKGLRIWHTNADSQGVALLKGRDGLTAITLGQRLAARPPAMVADDTLAVLLTIKSLESISLSEARLSVGALSRLKQLPALKRLSLDAIDISAPDVDKLRQELAGMQIEWTAPNANAARRIEALFDD